MLDSLQESIPAPLLPDTMGAIFAGIIMVLIDVIQTQMVLLHQIGRKLCRVVQCSLEVSILIDADLNADALLISLRRSRVVPHLLIGQMMIDLMVVNGIVP